MAHAILALSLLTTAQAGDAPGAAQLDASQSGPHSLGWMQGFPPSADKVIRGFDRDFFAFPRLRWTVCPFRQLMPTVEVRRGVTAPEFFPRRRDGAIDGITFEPLGGGPKMSWAEALGATFTDGVVVVHRGHIVYEKYRGCLNAEGKHAAMSLTKSMIGLLAEILIAEGKLDERARVRAVVPELSASAFGNATVRQVLDMTTSLRYSEDYADPTADVWRYTAAASPWPKPAGYEGPRSYFDFLKTVRSQGEHGNAFAYKTINTDALAWILARASGQAVHELLADYVWKRMGAEQSAYFTVDSTGTPFAGGGLNAGLRDMARVGVLMLNHGVWNGRRVFPARVAQRIERGGDKTAFAKAGYETLQGGSYRSMWWILHNSHGAYAARGVHGQTVYVDPKAEMVIARFASHPVAGNAANDPISLPAFQAVAEYLLTKRDT